MPSPQNAPAPEPGVPHPVDEVPQTFRPGSSYDVREELGDLISWDLLGPWADNETEALPPNSAGPRDRYLVGLLGPRPAPTDQPVKVAVGQAETEVSAEGDGQDAELGDRLTPQAAGRLWASSMGLSFLVPADVGMLSVVASWGRYRQSDSKTDDGRSVRTWSREPARHEVDVPVDAPGTFRTVLEGDDENDILQVRGEGLRQSRERGAGDRLNLRRARRRSELPLHGRRAEPSHSRRVSTAIPST